jgi:hypothetical protein
MIDEHQNFSLRGGTPKVKVSPTNTLAFKLSIESGQRWHGVEAHLYHVRIGAAPLAPRMPTTCP